MLKREKLANETLSRLEDSKEEGRDKIRIVYLVLRNTLRFRMEEAYAAV